MSMFGYYVLHSFVNQIRKLLKTWVAIVIVVCLLLGIVVGVTVTAVVIADSVEEELTDVEEQSSGIEDEDDTENEPLFTDEQKKQMPELMSGIILLVFALFAFTADNSVSSLFLPADVPLLFASPRKPQSVLVFRLSMQIGVIAVSSIYLLGQLPNLIHNFGLSVGTAASLLLVWFLTLAWGKLLQVFLYVFGSTHEKFKSRLRTYIACVIGVIGVGFYAYYRSSGSDLLTAACTFFNAEYTCLIPIWGWLKAIVVCSIQGKPLLLWTAVAVNVLAAGVFIRLIWRMKADYYEEALAKCYETAQMLAAAQAGKTYRKVKEKSDRLRRNGLNRGRGASVYFWKATYNRFRFAHLKYFTKTAYTYLLIGVGVSLMVKFLFKADVALPSFACLAVFSFYRTLGNPLQEDTAMDYFILIPENTWAKVWFSMLGSLTNCALDLLPGMIAASLITWENPLTALLWSLLILTLHFYATSVGAFIDFSVPTAAVQYVKIPIQVLFVYFGALPDVAAILLCALLLKKLWLGIAVAAVINCVIGGLFFVIGPAFLSNGRK